MGPLSGALSYQQRNPPNTAPLLGQSCGKSRSAKRLNNAAIEGRIDALDSIKENVIVGHLIPAGSGQAARKDFVVAHKADLEAKRL